MRTVISSDYRWEFGEYATVTVLMDEKIAAGKHHLIAQQILAPSYMPFTLEPACETDFVI